jgi:hypothetical protein
MRCSTGQVIGPPVGVDDEVGGEVGPGWLDQDMDFLGGGGSALGVPDDPVYGVARRNRTGADQVFALLLT